MSRFLFPRWSNGLLPGIVLIGGVLPIYVLYLVAYGFSPKTLEVGYQPVQPVPYSHALHAGELGIDCRYCHNTVERSAHAAVPPTQTCMNCHALVKPESPKITKVLESSASGMPIDWVRVHHVADYAFFNHAAHVNRGVGCVSCHGRVDEMEVVYQAQPMSMGWCLDCHRDPEPNLRPLSEITNMTWGKNLTVEEQLALDKQRLQLLDLYHISPSENCSTCHR